MLSKFMVVYATVVPCAAMPGEVWLKHPAGAGKLSVGHGSPGLCAALQDSDWRGSATPLQETGEDLVRQCLARLGMVVLGSVRYAFTTRRNAGRFYGNARRRSAMLGMAWRRYPQSLRESGAAFRL